MKPWKESTVWIIGASSGIGRAFALHLYGRGARVIVSAPDSESLEDVWKPIDADPDRYFNLYLDITDTDSLPAAVETAEKQFGGIDMLINNAGISQRALLTDTKPSIIEKLLKVNLLGHMILTRLVLPGMVEQKDGCILGTSSIAGKFGSPLRTIYSASKHGLQGFYDSLRAEVWRHNIQVTVGVPGFVRTDISRHALTGSGELYNKMDKNQAGGITPGECVEAIIRGVEKGKREVYTGLDMRAGFALFLQRQAPGLLAKIIRKSNVT